MEIDWTLTVRAKNILYYFNPDDEAVETTEQQAVNRSGKRAIGKKKNNHKRN